MAYTLLKLLHGGTYTSLADWRTQFEGASIVAGPATTSGEIFYPGSDSYYGIYAAYAFFTANPFEREICIPEASPTYPVQVYGNGVLIAERNGPGVETFLALTGINVFEVVRAAGPLLVVPAGPFIDPLNKTGTWLSLFALGSDPFSGGGSGTGVGIAEPTSTTL